MDDDQEHCMALAEPLLADCHEAWHLALAKYAKIPAQFTAEHDDTTAANCVRAYMWAEVVRRFDGRKGCKLLRLKGLNLLNHRDETLWRFKRVDGSGRHSNYQTKQQRDYDDQMELPDIPPKAIRLTSGYQPDASSLAIERIIVARPYGRSVVWASQVNMVSDVASWIDITPARLVGTERIDFRGRRR